MTENLVLVHVTDENLCDLGPSPHASDPDNICAHGFKVREEWR